MGADATLVAAAYRMGMANVPGDWSDSFNKMYEGISAGHIAKAKMFSDTFEAGIDAYADMKVRGAEGDEKATDMSTLKTLVISSSQFSPCLSWRELDYTHFRCYLL